MSLSRFPTVPELVLSLFPGVGLLDRAFSSSGFIVVQAQDKLTGGGIREFASITGRLNESGQVRRVRDSQWRIRIAATMVIPACETVANASAYLSNHYKMRARMVPHRERSLRPGRSNRRVFGPAYSDHKSGVRRHAARAAHRSVRRQTNT